MRAVLITGCSAGGIGSSLATAFQRHGYHVFATARSVSKMSHLASLPNMTLLTLEVTSSTSIQAAVAAVEDSGHRLEVLVNNAGIAPVMPLLDQDMAGAREVFETNVWGGLALVQAFKEVLVSGGGCVVNVGSMNALAVPAWMGVYNASKAAQHVLMETLRIELEPLGVRVLTVVTGAIDTVVMTKQAGTFRLPEDSMYTAIEGKLRERAEGHEVVPRTTPDDYAESVVKDVLAGKIQPTYRGRMVSVVYWVKTLAPWLLEMIRYRDIGLAELRKAIAGTATAAKSR